MALLSEYTPILASAEGRILIACVGNVLRGDDGFGQAVATQFGEPPEGVELIETGIGGIALLQELLKGCDGLVVVDAIDRGEQPGTVFVLEPEVTEARHVPDVHLANPERVLSMAKSLGCLPARVLIVGCQPGPTELGERLSPQVERAVSVALKEIEQAVSKWRAVH